MKVNQPPYFLLLDLAGHVDFVASSFSVNASAREISIVLRKSLRGRWPGLLFEGDAEGAAARRRVAEAEAAAKRAEVRRRSCWGWGKIMGAGAG